MSRMFSCQMYDFQKIARDLFDSTKTTVKRHIDENESTTQPGVHGVHVTQPLTQPSTIYTRFKPGKLEAVKLIIVTFLQTKQLARKVFFRQMKISLTRRQISTILPLNTLKLTQMLCNFSTKCNLLKVLFSVNASTSIKQLRRIDLEA